MNEQLFRKESLNKANGAEQTDEYLKVASPSFWLIVIAAVILVASFVYWGVAGTIPNRIAAVGIVQKGTVTVFMPADNIMAIGDSLEVLIDGTSHAVTGVENELFSAEQIQQTYGEFLNPAGMNFVITADAAGVPDGVKGLSVVISRTRVLDYMWEQSHPENA